MPPNLMPPFDSDENESVWDYEIDIGDKTLRFVITYRSRQDAWYLSIYRSQVLSDTAFRELESPTVDSFSAVFGARESEVTSVPILTGYRLNIDDALPIMASYRLPDLGTTSDPNFVTDGPPFEPYGPPFFGILETSGSGDECDFDGMGARCFVYQSDLGTVFVDAIGSYVTAGQFSFAPGSDTPLIGGITFDEWISLLVGQYLRPASIEINP